MIKIQILAAKDKKPNISLSLIFKFVFVFGLCVLLTILSPVFLSWGNIINVLLQSTILLVVGLGLTVVLITAGIDLSVGGTLALVGCLTAQILKSGVPIPLVILIGIIVGGLIGVINGVLVGVVKIPPFVATYGMMWITEGIAMIFMQGRIIFGFPQSFRWIGSGFIGPIPVPVIIAALVAVLGHFFLKNTAVGREIYALGSNKDVAYYSGIRMEKILIIAYTFCGIMAGIAGLIMTARMNAAQAGMGSVFVLQGIASVVMGGTSLKGGVGGVQGTVIGALILTLIVNGMNLLGISSLLQSVVTGVVIIGAVYFDQLSKKKS